MKIKNHKLQDVPYVNSPNYSPLAELKYLIIHFTAGRSSERSVKHLTKKSSKASAHLVIGRDGDITQLVPFNKAAWHAGKSEWKDIVGLNKYSIGIELDNVGSLKKNAAGKWMTYFGREIPDEQVMVARHKNGGPPRGWQIYTEKQMDALEDVAELLFEKYNLEDVLGHDDIAPKRKTDPGPAFDMHSLRSALLGRDREDVDWDWYKENDTTLEFDEFMGRK